MSEWQSAMIDGNGIRLHYTRTGGDKPPFVLAHGFSDDGLCWTPVAEQLAVDYDVIMPDARGHGRSDAPEEGYGDAYFAADLAALIRELGLEKPLILGHSMGAATALALAGLCPDIPGAILLSDPPVRWPTTPVAVAPGGDAEEDPDAEAAEEIDWLARTRAWITELQSKTREELIAEERANSGWSDAELGPWADAKLRLRLTVLGRGDDPGPDWQAIIPQITCPALLITADPARGSLVTAEAAADLKALLPQLQIAHIADAGHSIRRDQFDRYMDAVDGFVAGLK